MGDVGAVERYNTGLVPLLDKRKQVHTSVAEINVHQIGSVAPQQRVQRLILAAINNRRPPFDEFQPTVHKQVSAPLRNHFDVVKRKSLSILDFFGDDKSVHAAQRPYLPIDVQHLRLQKTRTITRYNPPAHNTAPSFARDAHLVHLKSLRKHSLRGPLFALPTPASMHQFLLLWLLKSELPAALGISLAALLDFPSHPANPFCWQPRTRRATISSDRRDQFPGADSANLRSDCVPRFRRHRARKSKRGSA